MKNKKILNATKVISEGIEFKSKLEEICYKMFKQNGLKLLYEQYKFVMIEKFNTKNITTYEEETTFQYKKRIENKGEKHIRLIKKVDSSNRELCYTPDFYIKYKGVDIFIETKGIENDTFYIKKKLFKKYLNTNFPKSYYFILKNKEQMKQAIEIIKKL